MKTIIFILLFPVLLHAQGKSVRNVTLLKDSSDKVNLKPFAFIEYINYSFFGDSIRMGTMVVVYDDSEVGSIDKHGKIVINDTVKYIETLSRLTRDYFKWYSEDRDKLYEKSKK